MSPNLKARIEGALTKHELLGPRSLSYMGMARLLTQVSQCVCFDLVVSWFLLGHECQNDICHGSCIRMVAWTHIYVYTYPTLGYLEPRGKSPNLVTGT